MGIITLLTDWGGRDFYVAKLKACLLSVDTSLTIVDITHDIRAFNTGEAAFILKNCFRDFPVGSLHFVGIQEYYKTSQNRIIIEKDGHYIIGFENDFFQRFLDSPPERAWKVSSSDQEEENRAHCLLPRIVRTLLQGESLSTIAVPYDYEKLLNFRYTFSTVIEQKTDESGQLVSVLMTGKVFYIDHFENAIVNIKDSEFYEYQKRFRNFEIKLRPSSSHLNRFNNEIITQISNTYPEDNQDDLIARFACHHFLELSLHGGKMASLLGIGEGSPIFIQFSNPI